MPGTLGTRANSSPVCTFLGNKYSDHPIKTLESFTTYKTLKDVKKFQSINSIPKWHAKKYRLSTNLKFGLLLFGLTVNQSQQRVQPIRLNTDLFRNRNGISTSKKSHS